MVLLQKSATRDEILAQGTIKQREGRKLNFGFTEKTKEMSRRSSKGSECLHKPKKLSNEFGPSYTSYFNLSRNSRQYEYSIDLKHDGKLRVKFLIN